MAGLGKVSKTFKRWLLDMKLYDPFAGAPSWKDLGYTSPKPEANPELIALAKAAYAEILKTLKKELGKSDMGKPLEAVVNVSIQRGLIGRNCLAQLKLGTKSLVAVNFVFGIHDNNFEMAAKDLKSDRSSVNYKLVEARHGEMRLIIKLTDPKTDASLNVDKLCCVFCAAQIYALGFKKLITGWRSGSLQWYNFSPIVMFFPKRREKIWGSDVEEKFKALGSSDQKRQFLRLLVEQTNAEAESLAPKRNLPHTSTDAPAKKTKANRATCRHCGAELVVRWVTGKPNNTFWGCPNYRKDGKGCKGDAVPMA